jgi:hypothetical protein
MFGHVENINPIIESSVDTKHYSLRKIKQEDIPGVEESKEQPTVPVIYNNNRIVRQEEQIVNES